MFTHQTARWVSAVLVAVAMVAPVSAGRSRSETHTAFATEQPPESNGRNRWKRSWWRNAIAGRTSHNAIAAKRWTAWHRVKLIRTRPILVPIRG